MIAVVQQIGFSAAHYYYNPDFSEGENQRLFGLCANRAGHGHNYVVEITLAGEIDTETGMVINFFDLAPVLKRVVQTPWDHQMLNYLPEFQNRIPTLENMALILWDTLCPEVMALNLKLHHIKLSEASDLWVDYTGPDSVAA